MTPLILFPVLLIGLAAGLFAGLIICANTDLGDVALDNVPRELIKCIIVAAVTAGVIVGLSAVAQNPRVFLGVIPFYYLGLKIGWLDISFPELFVMSVTGLVGLAVALGIMFQLLS